MSLLVGICAAIAWAVHDLFVRVISQKISILPALLSVLLFGAVFIAPFAIIKGEWNAMTQTGYGLTALTGIAFALASLSLYHAFQIGPVRLVAPIIGAYPVLSVAWGTLSGLHITAVQWIGVFIVVGGVAIVARLSDTTAANDRKPRAIVLSVLAGIGFAVTFAAGQAAIHHGADLVIILTSRLIAAGTIAGLILVLRQSYRVPRSKLPLLALLGALDATALGLVLSAGSLPHPEFAAVASSLFGMLTIILARFFLNEPMTRAQWVAVAMVFCGIFVLGL